MFDLSSSKRQAFFLFFRVDFRSERFSGSCWNKFQNKQFSSCPGNLYTKENLCFGNLVCSQAVLFAASVVGETFLMTGVDQINFMFHLSRSNTKISAVLLINKGANGCDHLL